ncbi:MAG TPA: PP2C family serine/threonine-protein phosphatase [Anaeromyxobacteraceae bacterium]|nr:PP2C family serine/threonine-protein phosphatase [Anaeromyxobacteraceae bacterium]
MRVTWAGATNVGMKRTLNEDAFLLLPEESLFCVADGMGGHASGEVASRIAVAEMAEFFRVTGRDEDATWPFREDPARSYDENRLLTAIKLANVRIHERGQSDAKLRNMGTTLVSVFFPRGGGEALVGHVGDSRVYHLRRGAIRQVTEDHSLLNDYIKSRRPTPEEIQAFPHKNVIIRALGMRPHVEVDLLREPLEPEDLILLCCDGLTGMVPDPRIAELVRGHPGDLQGACDALVAAANEAGGVDNITCVLVQAHA